MRLPEHVYRETEYRRYDRDRGEVQTLSMDLVIREAIEVRRGLEDAVVLTAVVEELRRRGYTVHRPDPDACPGRCVGPSHRPNCPDWSLPL